MNSIILNIQFNEETSNNELLQTIEYYKTKVNISSGDAPLGFLDKKNKNIIFDKEKNIRVSLYKILLFIKIANAIKSGSLNLSHSYKYRSFDEYLIPKEKWDKNKDHYIKKAGLEKYCDADKILSELALILDKSYEKTNMNIISEANEWINFDRKGNVKITTPKVEKEETSYNAELFINSKYISLSQVLASINRYSSFTDSFEHFKIKSLKKRPHINTFIAGIMAYGCNLGIGKLAKSLFKKLYNNKLLYI